jgi:hypothetical protein
MVRLLVRLVVAVLANAIGLIVAALVLDDMALSTGGFLLAVLVFTGVQILILPALQKAAIKRSEALAGGSALVAALVGLIVADVVSDGVSISGTVTWLLAAVIVWAVVLLAGILLPATIFKRWLQERR